MSQMSRRLSRGAVFCDGACVRLTAYDAARRVLIAMHVIIDGYNLSALAGWSGASPHSEAARESLLRLLSAYRHRKGHALTVVFDGWQQGQPIEGREHRSGVQVIYSKRGEKADQVIERLAQE